MNNGGNYIAWHNFCEDGAEFINHDIAEFLAEFCKFRKIVRWDRSYRNFAPTANIRQMRHAPIDVLRRKVQL